MKRHPFLEGSFILRLRAGDRVLTSLSMSGADGMAPIVNVKADRVFVMTSRMAHKIVRFLVSDPEGKERLAYGTGYRLANILTLDQFIPVKTQNSSRVHVDPEPEARIAALEELDRHGLALQALFHSHPGETEHSVNPSPQDMETQHNLERSYGAIGAICNAGGFLQFFSTAQLFQLVIVGKGIEDYGLRKEEPGFRHLVRLCEFGDDPLPARQSGWLERVAHRSAKAVGLV